MATAVSDVTLEGAEGEAERLAAIVREHMALVGQQVGAASVAYLRSLTEEMRPPARTQRALRTAGRRKRALMGPIDARRPAHPGHWADVTGLLAAGYQFEVATTADGAEVRLTNAVEYADDLEKHEGYFVLTGVAEPGGPVDRLTREAWAKSRPALERKVREAGRSR